ncbi:helix-turn-helix domain-containing protein [Paracoccus seriniphilus]|uniref:DNA binding domain-containing protein, excisionase family n=1 Tax=Paracoccus seriniphilus TaxID=184748 RepID=A0A239Q1S0_9RHOB|nr:helix-turn-helix domain-containing protein [Paracoccus seriniphilus]WCR15754.1 helix-turn-helix domain-containing protein [Paracoccus seriniphilus]SNT76206.1 DNA binding domain-containing protein, excisionase family [Paracoccus seriniphilus]
MPSDQYHTVKEVAELLKVSEMMVRRWIKDGELRAIDIGKGWRIGSEDLDIFLARHATQPADQTRATTGKRPEASDGQESGE